MAETYIPLSAALNAIRNYDFKAPEFLDGWARRCRQAMQADLTDDMKAIPSADVRPVVRGKWEDINLGWARCTNCKLFVIGSREKSQYRFCPNCGADMGPRKENADDGS